LSVENLKTHFHTHEGTVKAVDGASFEVNRGETVCIVGESGSGKTVACESLTKLISMPPGEMSGNIWFDAVLPRWQTPDGGVRNTAIEDSAIPVREDGMMNLAALSKTQLHEIRGGHIGHVFQNPQGALDPVYTVGQQIIETIRLHRDEKAKARERAIDLLDRVGIPDASSRIDEYPHEFSGGMRQRVVIAMALAADPDLLIADEPTTALDVTIQAGILRLLDELKDDLDMAIVFVTHDLGVVAEIADRVVVMYAGKVMERGGVYELFENPAHPYTQALFACLPEQGKEMNAIGGSFPDPKDPPEGCRFHPRCPHAIDACATGEQPPLEGVNGTTQTASCVFYGPEYDESTVRGPAHKGTAPTGAERADGGTE
ncbi:MAG TPA: ABC transporter ATP-binding protein, partial [Halococcus sp.]|nr:ABC transporter ATP-binding protein [Halococcus sp.]